MPYSVSPHAEGEQPWSESEEELRRLHLCQFGREEVTSFVDHHEEEK